MIKGVANLLRMVRPDARGLEIFSSLLFAGAHEDRFAKFDERKLAAFARDAFAFLMNRGRSGYSVRVRDIDLGKDEGDYGVGAVVEILTDDLPFILESVMGEINAQGLRAVLVLNPTFKVLRYGSERLREVLAAGDGDWKSGQECYLAILTGPVAAADQRGLAAALERVLQDLLVTSADEAAMRSRLSQAITAMEGLSRSPDLGMPQAQTSSPELLEAAAYLKWLGQGHFTFLGMRDYEFIGADDKVDLWPAPKGALGLLRTPDVAVLGPGSDRLAVTADLRALYFSPKPIIINRASIAGSVGGRRQLAYVGAKTYNASGRLVGELRIVGHFTPLAHMQPLGTMPILRRRVEAMLAEAGLVPGSHAARRYGDVLERLPREDVLELSSSELLEFVRGAVEIELAPRSQILARRDAFGRFFSFLVFLPKDRCSAEICDRVAEDLAASCGGRLAHRKLEFQVPDLGRLQVVVDVAGAAGTAALPLTAADFERRISVLVDTWEDRLTAAIQRSQPGGQSRILIDVYRDAFPAEYKSEFGVERALQDISRLERLAPGQLITVDFYRTEAMPATRLHAVVCRPGEPLPLSQLLPLIECLGLHVIDTRSYRITPRRDDGARHVAISECALERIDGRAVDVAQCGPQLSLMVAALQRGNAAIDGFNGLVLMAGIDWRQAALLRSCATYLAQADPHRDMNAFAAMLADAPTATRSLIELFTARFDPELPLSLEAREAKAEKSARSIEAARADCTSGEGAHCLGLLLALLRCITRTNYFQRDKDGHPPNAIAFKCDGRATGLRADGSRGTEIWVQSARMMGLHARADSFAAGPLFAVASPRELRAETIGRCRAQGLLNAGASVTGSASGFGIRTTTGRSTDEPVTSQVDACQAFVAAVLSLTDNLATDGVRRPDRVVCHDPGDPHLVLLVDDTTAAFGEAARRAASACGYWLGQAIVEQQAAGGISSAGMLGDRSAWQNLERHLAEASTGSAPGAMRVLATGAPSSKALSAIMRAGRQIRLVAAIDAHDIFVDPAPDDAVAAAERSRLADRAGAAWRDFDRGKISQGGGVFSRTDGQIALSPEIRAMLRVNVTAMSPDELVGSLFASETDLLWLGDDTALVIASSEADLIMPSAPRHAVRIKASELGARIITEGIGEPRLTQPARIEAALRGVRLNSVLTDAIAASSAADRQSNINIAFADPASSTSGLAAVDGFRALLRSLDDEITAAALADGHQAALALSLAEQASRHNLDDWRDLARQVETDGWLDRRRDVFPDEATLGARQAGGTGLTRPELAVLLAAGKMALKAKLHANAASTDPSFEPLLTAYFPTPLRARFSGQIGQHRLRREIIASRIANVLSDRCGPALVTRIARNCGRPINDIAIAAMAAIDIFRFDALWQEIDTLEGKVAGATLLDVHTVARADLLDVTAALLAEPPQGYPELVGAYRSSVERIEQNIASIATPPQREAISAAAHGFVEPGIPEPLARRIAGFTVLRQVFRLVKLAARSDKGIAEIARLVFAIEDIFQLGSIKQRALTLGVNDRYDQLVIENALATIEHAQSTLLDGALGEDIAVGDVMAWGLSRMGGLGEAKALIDAMVRSGDISLARLALVAAHLRGTTPDRVRGGS